MPTSISEYDEMTDDPLTDIGMYRCECDKATYAKSDPAAQHCEQAKS